MTPQELQLTRALAACNADALNNGMSAYQVLSIMRSCVAELEDLVPKLEPGTATRRALDAMKAEGTNDIDSLLRHFSAAGGMVLTSGTGPD